LDLLARSCAGLVQAATYQLDSIVARIPNGVLAVLTATSLTCCLASSASRFGSVQPLSSDPDAQVLESPAHYQRASALSRGALWATWNQLRGDAYPLDTLDRSLDIGEKIACDARSLIAYRGRSLPYRSTAWVNPAFRERLERFEDLVREVALEIYGRAPRRLDHLGAYNCRSTRHHVGRLSEHALGNALDVSGFEFGPAPKQGAAARLPKGLRGAFRVRVSAHWAPRSDDPAAALHTRFLHELTARCEQRSDVFRVLIGPSQRDHADHFHFDMSPWHYVNL
jgi:hypothetical protein